MGSASSTPGAVEDYNIVKSEFNGLQSSHASQIKSNFELSQQLGSLINKIELLRIKSGEEERAIVLREGKSASPSEQLRKVQAMQIHMKLMLSDLTQWRNEEHKSIARQKEIERRMEWHKELLEEVEKGNVTDIQKVVANAMPPNQK